MSEFEKYSIRDLINKLVIKQPHLRLAEVVNVDRAKKTCDAVCTSTDMELLGTRLMAIESDLTNRLVIYPKIGSVILVGIVDGSNTFVMLQAGETDGMELNGSEYSLVKGEELKAEITKLKETVDALVSVVKGAPITEAGSGANSSLQLALKSAISGKETGSFSGILNEKVKHG